MLPKEVQRYLVLVRGQTLRFRSSASRHIRHLQIVLLLLLLLIPSAVSLPSCCRSPRDLQVTKRQSHLQRLLQLNLQTRNALSAAKRMQVSLGTAFAPIATCAWTFWKRALKARTALQRNPSCGLRSCQGLLRENLPLWSAHDKAAESPRQLEAEDLQDLPAAAEGEAAAVATAEAGAAAAAKEDRTPETVRLVSFVVSVSLSKIMHKAVSCAPAALLVISVGRGAQINGG